MMVYLHFYSIKKHVNFQFFWNEVNNVIGNGLFALSYLKLYNIIA